MIRSMTGYASASGETQNWRWSWELRAVNARGLDLRLRLPERPEGLEPEIRAAFRGRVARGALSLSLRLKSESGAAVLPDAGRLAPVLAAIKALEEAALAGHDLELRPSSGAEILDLWRATGGAGEEEPDLAPLRAALLDGLDGLIDSFNAMREAEGQALAALLAGQLERIQELTEAAGEAARARSERQRRAMGEALERLRAGAEGLDEERIAQELALLAVKADVTEELDRLQAHVEAARALLAGGGAVGRKLDFLTQEFLREANTLCSKAQDAALGAIGLDLKAVIDQMREQVQNVE